MATFNNHCVGRGVSEQFGVSGGKKYRKLPESVVTGMYRQACTKLAGVFCEIESHHIDFCQLISTDNDGLIRIRLFGSDEEGRVRCFRIVFDSNTFEFAFDKRYVKEVKYDVEDGEVFDVKSRLFEALKVFVGYIKQTCNRPVSVFEFPVISTDVYKDEFGVWKYKVSTFVKEGIQEGCKLQAGTDLVVLLNSDESFYDEYMSNSSGTDLS